MSARAAEVDADDDDASSGGSSDLGKPVIMGTRTPLFQRRRAHDHHEITSGRAGVSGGERGGGDAAAIGGVVARCRWATDGVDSRCAEGERGVETGCLCCYDGVIVMRTRASARVEYAVCVWSRVVVTSAAAAASAGRWGFLAPFWVGRL